jgi:intracellular septation protein
MKKYIQNKVLASFILNFLIEAFPLVVFTASYFIYKDFFFSVLLLVVCTFTSLVVLWTWKKRVSYIDLYVLFTVLIFDVTGYVTGSVSMVTFRDTFYDGVLGLLCLVTLFNKKTILEYMLSAYCDLTPRGWWLATLRTGILLLSLASVNEIVRNFMSLDTWVIYRSCTYFIIILFIIIFLPQMRRHSPDHAKTFSFIVN